MPSRRPDVDYTALPTPSNLPQDSSTALTYEALMTALNERNALERRLDDLNGYITGLRNKVLDVMCPVVDGGDLPIERNVLVDVSKRDLSIVEDPANEGAMLLRWSVEGTRVSFKDGVKTEGRQVEVEQATYDALPADIKAQTRASIRAATPLATNLRRPLSWTEPSASMFGHLKDAFRGTAFDASVRLPSPIWDNESATRRIYLSLVKQGVIELGTSPKGVVSDPGDSLTSWYVQRGPRFDEFANQLAEEQARKRVVAPARRSSGPR